MSIGAYFRGVNWPATARLLVMRAFAGALVWGVIFSLGESSFQNGISTFANMGIFFFVLAIAFASVALLLVGVISGANLPGIVQSILGFIVFLPAWLLIVVGNPIIWTLHRIKPELVGPENFPFLASPAYFVYADGSDVPLGASQAE